MTYADELRKPQWQRKRLEIMARDGWSCKGCQADAKTLNVHHQRYIAGRKPWEYADEDLTTLCEECHKLLHTVNDAYKAKDIEEKHSLIERILSGSATIVRRGPFIFSNHPKRLGHCIIVHVPSGLWHGFTMTVEQALNMHDESPSSVAELRTVILEGASAQPNPPHGAKPHKSSGRKTKLS